MQQINHTSAITGPKNDASSPQSMDQSKRSVDESQWEIVKTPSNVKEDGTFNENDVKACSQGHIHDDSLSVHFDIRLGWGKWKWKLFSIDYNQTKRSGN